MQNTAWITLFFAGLLETGWALGLKYTEGFTKVGPSVATIILMVGSFYLLSRSLTTLYRDGVCCLDGYRGGGRNGHRRDRVLRRVQERHPPPLHLPDRSGGDRGGAAVLFGCVKEGRAGPSHFM